MLSKPARQLAIKKTRRIDDNKKRLLAEWIQHESWEGVYDGGTSSGMAVNFIDVVNGNIDKICPEVEVRISQLDGKVTSLALQTLSRQKKREYTKNGNSQKFKDIKRKQKDRIRLEGQKLLERHIEAATEGRGMK